MAKDSFVAGVITLAGPKGRKAHIETLKKRLRAQDIKLFRWIATTPETLPEITFDYRSFNSAYEIACLCSHLALTQRLAASDADYGIVFEDDAILHKNVDFKALIASAPPDWEILSLGTSNPNYYSLYDLMAKHGGPNWLTWHQPYWGAHTYILKHSVMESLERRFWNGGKLLNLSNLYDPFNMVADHLVFRCAVTYVSRFPWSTWDTDTGTSVQIGRAEAKTLVERGAARIRAVWAAAGSDYRV